MRFTRVAAAATVVLASACARSTWIGQDALTRAVPSTPDATLAAAAQALAAHGYKPQLVNGQLVVTLPQPVPQYTREVSTNPAGEPQRWIIEVTAAKNDLQAGSALTVMGYLVPPPTPGDSGSTRTATPVTQRDQALFREVQRIGNWIVDAVRSPAAADSSHSDRH